MKTLTKYLLRGLIWPLFYCLLGFSLLFVISDLFENLSDFLEAGVKLSEICYYYSLILPTIAVYITPVCLLLAILYSLSNLTRHSEITAMRAGGVSIYRITCPYLFVGIIATLAVGAVNECLAPNAAYRSDQFLEYQKQNRLEDIYYATNIALKSNGKDWFIGKFDTRNQSMYNVQLIEKNADGTSQKIQAEKALWLDGRWWFMDMSVQRYNAHNDLLGAPELILQKEMRELTETPQTFMSEIKDPEYLSSLELKNYLESKQDLSEDNRARLSVDLHSRLAAPLICLIVAMIGIPIGSRTGRQGALSGIMFALVLFFSFYIFRLFSQGLGKQQYIAAWLGGWLPIIVYGILGPFMIHRMR